MKFKITVQTSEKIRNHQQAAGRRSKGEGEGRSERERVIDHLIIIGAPLVWLKQHLRLSAPADHISVICKAPRSNARRDANAGASLLMHADEAFGGGCVLRP